MLGLNGGNYNTLRERCQSPYRGYQTGQRVKVVRSAPLGSPARFWHATLRAVRQPGSNLESTQALLSPALTTMVNAMSHTGCGVFSREVIIEGHCSRKRRAVNAACPPIGEQGCLTNLTHLKKVQTSEF